MVRTHNLRCYPAFVGVEILNHCIKPPKTGRDLSWEACVGKRMCHTVEKREASHPQKPAWCSCAHVVMLYGPTRHSTATEASQRTVYRRSAQECVQRDLNHVIAEEYETPKCLWTAAASYDAELDRGDGVCVAIFGPLAPKIYLPGPLFTGGTVTRRRPTLVTGNGEVTTIPQRAECTRTCEQINHSTSMLHSACSTGVTQNTAQKQASYNRGTD